MTASSLFDLAGKTAIVTGGASGIGQAVALGLAASGADVVIADLNRAAADAMVPRLVGLGRQALAVSVDVTQPAQVAGLLDASRSRFGDIDVLVNAAGINIRGASTDVSDDDINRVLQVNLMGVLHCCRHIGASMVERGSGSIVNISSIMGALAAPRILAYVTSKGGVSQLTRALGVEWATTGVRVNAVGPGYCRTPLINEVIDDPAWLARVEQRTPMGRLAEPEEIVGPVLFLASPAASYVTGTVLYVDGGYTAS
ncbi:MAG TPA: glucose 1-dehydrogenase [Chloroflexota bacterium]|nr:glucose 1-dehydrogenase [Chloroflexota bacterium]